VELTDSSVNLENKPLWLDQMETVLEVLNEGVIVADENRRILFANSRFVEMTGLSREDLFQFDPLRFFSAQERDFLKRQVDVEFEAGHNRYTFALPSKGGGRVPVIVSSRTFQNLGSRFGVVTFTDITEQVQAEEELRAANAKLESRQQEIEEDLRLAARVQNSLTPSSFVSDSLRLDVFYHPVHSVGGDFALVHSQDREHVSLLVCDVSGHGIGAALVANRIYSETTTHLRSGMPFPDMFEKLNRFLLEDIAGSSMYVTLAAARIDSRLLRMDYAGAGHPPAMLARHGQVPKLLESRSMILGALPEAVDPTPALHVELQPDDRIIFYTDGITEVFNSRGEMLGTSGVQEIVRQASSLRAEEMKQAILDGVSRWRNGPPTDDVSLMVVNVR
jgi:PAS domain S-box-containing protein